jgi:hypothetical protein
MHMGIMRISSFAFPNLFVLLILNYSLNEIEHFIHLNEKENLLGQFIIFNNLLMIYIYIYNFIEKTMVVVVKVFFQNKNCNVNTLVIIHPQEELAKFDYR